MIPSFWLYQSAFGLQLVALALFSGYAAAPRRSFSSAATACLALSLALLLAQAGALGQAYHGLPLASGFEFVLLWSAILTALVVWVEWRHQLGLLGAFVSPLSAVTLLMGFRFAREAAQPAAGLPTPWLLVHVLCVVAAFACFTATAGVAGAFLVQQRQLKRARLGSLSYTLPPLGVLESLAARLGLAGLSLLGLSLWAGFLWRWRWSGGFGLEDAKVQFAVAVAGAWCVALLLRARGLLQGRRLAYAFIVLFLIVLFGYYLVNLYLSGHGFLRPGGA
jgi:ABC-type transport system involved in cytochrome c biogenesis permease subunit